MKIESLNKKEYPYPLEVFGEEIHFKSIGDMTHLIMAMHHPIAKFKYNINDYESAIKLLNDDRIEYYSEENLSKIILSKAESYINALKGEDTFKYCLVNRDYDLIFWGYVDGYKSAIDSIKKEKY
jgi:hypothetical protein